MWLLLACTSPSDDPIRAPGPELDELTDTSPPADSSPPDDTAPGDTSPPATPDTHGPRGLLVAQSWDREDAPYGAGAGQYRYIVLQESMTSILDEVRAANPDARILAYQKVGGMRSDGGDNPSTGVQTHEADDGHEGWYLHDASGNRLEYCDYAGVMAADIGDPTYQLRWLQNVRERLLRDGFDGVMMDDVNTFPGHCLGEAGTAIAEYPTDEAYGDAVVAFVEAVGPDLLAAGLLVAPNVAMNPWDDTMRAQTLAMFPHVSHLTREYWMRWDDSANFTGDNWLQTLTLMEDAEDAGVGVLALTYGPGEEGVTEGQVYGRASQLLAWDGEADSAWGYLDDEVDPWSEVWATDLGLPQEDRRQDGVGWRRAYSHGTVLVNPDEALSQTFEVDGTELTVGPGRALIRSSAAPAPSPAR